MFSKGNIILCDKERKIVGLLEWQKWRDRKLGVGLVYEYPPRTVNPITLTGEDISRMLDESQRDLVRTLASCGLPGLYAEEVCARAGADKNASAAGLGALKARVVDSFISLVEEVRGGKSSSKIILGDGNPVDVVPLDLRAHADSHSKPYSSFNEAVDEYFSSAEFDARKKASESEHAREKGKLEKRLSEQEKALERARGEVYEYRRIGDLLFSRKHEIEALVSEIKLQRKKGASDNEILAQLTKTGLVKDLNKTELTLML
jgi:predicted ribosome quality control (RQC) complex YloA/Tae2 family protein